MKIPPSLLFLFLFFFLFFSSFLGHQVRPMVAAKDTATSIFDLGVVLDQESPGGKRSWTSISMAIEDFNSAKESYTTEVVLHPRDSKAGIVDAASAALELLKNTEVQAIIGPKTSAQTEFIINLGNKSQVPVLSFSATSPSLSPARLPYFLRTTMNDSSQIGAIAAIVKICGWRQVVPVYEDTELGTGIVPYLVDALEAIDARIPYRSVIPLSASDDQIAAELYKLMTMQTRVFVVHMTPALGSRIFTKATELGLMSKEYVWIATDSIANTMALLDNSTIDAMQGVIGLRPYVARSKVLDNFTARWRARFQRENPSIELEGPTIFELWAYDTAWAIALAAEKARVSTSTEFQKPTDAEILIDLSSLGVSKAGPKLLDAMKKTRFKGIAGDFELIEGQLQSSAFEVVNVIGRNARRVGFWTSAKGLSRELNSAAEKSSPGPVLNLKPIVWPGDTTAMPKGWQIPTNGRRLRIGVPMAKDFKQFVKVEWDPNTNTSQVTGYCIDVFDAVMQMLPYYVPYDYVPFGNASSGVSAGSYDDLVQQVYLGKFDAVVGDVTIVSNRSNYIDFTHPYMESGVSFIVPVKDNGNKNAWIFLKPLTTDLWLGSLAFFFFTGFVVWVLEHRINEEFRGQPSNQLGLVFYFVFSTLTFSHKEKLASNLSRFVVIIWVFVVLVLTSCYTASLTSMLTVQQFKPTVTDVNELRRNGEYVGYEDGSFAVNLLKQMKFPENRLRKLSNPEEYAEALYKGSKNGGVAAIFDEIPYLKLFLSNSKYCANYTMLGQTYKTDGFGFVFPLGSPLVPDVSRMILNMREGDNMAQIERKWLGDPSVCPTQRDNFSSTSLDFWSFAGIFLITGVVSTFALIIFLANFLYNERKELRVAASGSSLGKRFKAWFKYFDSKDLKSNIFKREKELHTINNNRNVDDPARGGVAASITDGLPSPYNNCLDVNFNAPDEGMPSSALETPWRESSLNCDAPDEGMPSSTPETPWRERPVNFDAPDEGMPSSAPETLSRESPLPEASIEMMSIRSEH